MKNLLLVLLTFLINTVNAQVDTVIDCGVYKSYFDYESIQPLYVSYKLYKGGGNCSRDKFRFKNDTQIKTAELSDYDNSGYDMGHLANAKDFAFDCVKDEKTFRFYNCLPQFPNLNRGCWKRWETKIREESQKDSLLVICGGVDFKNKIKAKSSVLVPDFCWKIVVSLSSNQVLYAIWFENSKVAKESPLKKEELLNRIPYKVNLTY